MRITLTIETGKNGNSHLGFSSDGEPSNNQEQIIADVVMAALNGAAEILVSLAKETTHTSMPSVAVGRSN